MTEEFKPGDRVEVSSPTLGKQSAEILGPSPYGGWLLLLDKPAPSIVAWTPSATDKSILDGHADRLGIEKNSPKFWQADQDILQKLPMTQPTNKSSSDRPFQVGDRVKDKDGRVGTVFTVGYVKPSDEWTRVVYDYPLAESKGVALMSDLQTKIVDMGLIYSPDRWKAFGGRKKDKDSGYDVENLTKIPSIGQSTKEGDRVLLAISYDGKRDIVVGTVLENGCEPLALLDKPHSFAGTKQTDTRTDVAPCMPPQDIKQGKALAKKLGLSFDESRFTALPNGISKWCGKDYELDILAILPPSISAGDFVEVSDNGYTVVGVVIEDGQIALDTYTSTACKDPTAAEEAMARAFGLSNANYVIRPTNQIIRKTDKPIDLGDVDIGDEIVFVDPDDVEHKGVVVDRYRHFSTPFVWVKSKKGSAKTATYYSDTTEYIRYQAKALGLKGGYYAPIEMLKSITKKAAPKPKIKLSKLKVGDKITFTNSVCDYVDMATVVYKSGETIIVASPKHLKDDGSYEFSELGGLTTIDKKVIKGLETYDMPTDSDILMLDESDHEILAINPSVASPAKNATKGNILPANNLLIGDSILVEHGNVDVEALVVAKGNYGQMSVVSSQKLDDFQDASFDRINECDGNTEAMRTAGSIPRRLYKWYSNITKYKSKIRTPSVKLRELKPGDLFTFVHKNEVVNARFLVDHPTEGILFEFEPGDVSTALFIAFEISLNSKIDSAIVKELDLAAIELGISRRHKYTTGRVLEGVDYDIRIIARKPHAMKTSTKKAEWHTITLLGAREAINNGDQISVLTGKEGAEAVVLDAAKSLAILVGGAVLAGAKKLTAAQKKKAAALGIENATHCINYENKVSKVKRATFTKPEDLELGDKVHFKSGKKTIIGTVVLSSEFEEEGDVVIYLDEKDADKDATMDLSSFSEEEIVRTNLQYLGIALPNKTKDHFAYILSTDDQIEVIKKGNPRPKIQPSSLKPGDRFSYVSHGRKFNATCIIEESEDFEAYVVIDPPDSIDDLPDFDADVVGLATLEDWDKDQEALLFKAALDYGFAISDDTLVKSLSDCDIFEVLGKTNKVKARPLHKVDLAPGDKIELRIISLDNKKAKKVSATYIDDGYVLLDKRYKSSYRKSFSLDAADCSDEVVDRIEELGLTLDSDDERLWVIEDHDTEIIKITKRATAPKQKDTTMEEKETSFMDTFKADLGEAGYRICATQMTSGVTNGLALALSKGDGDKAAMVRSFLETDIGKALVGYMLGVGLPHAPGFQDDPRIQKLASEFRTNGLAVAGNAVVGQAMEYVLPAIKDAMQSLPALPEKAATGVRVKSPPKLVDNEEHSTEETAKVATVGRR